LPRHLTDGRSENSRRNKKYFCERGFNALKRAKIFFDGDAIEERKEKEKIIKFNSKNFGSRNNFLNCVGVLVNNCPFYLIHLIFP
jgi:hypothetical protein